MPRLTTQDIAHTLDTYGLIPTAEQDRAVPWREIVRILKRAHGGAGKLLNEFLHERGDSLLLIKNGNSVFQCPRWKPLAQWAALCEGSVLCVEINSTGRLCATSNPRPRAGKFLVHSDALRRVARTQERMDRDAAMERGKTVERGAVALIGLERLYGWKTTRAITATLEAAGLDPEWVLWLSRADKGSASRVEIRLSGDEVEAFARALRLQQEEIV